MGIAVNNLLAIYKVALVGFIIVTGIAASSTGPGDGEGGASGWETVNLDPGVGDYASAVLGVLWAYTGWENANYVLSEVRRPLGNEGRVFKVAAFSSVGLLTTLYIDRKSVV